MQDMKQQAHKTQFTDNSRHAALEYWFHTHQCLYQYLSHTLMMWSESPIECEEIQQFWLAEEAGSEHIPTANDQWKAQTVSDWTNQNCSSWWAQQGLDNQ